jgi:hypothetical protein
MRGLRWIVACVLPVLLGCSLASPLAAQSVKPQPQLLSDPGYRDDPTNWVQQFVPDYRPFWDNSKNWTTNYGPAYRDTIQQPSQMLACSPQFALCFHSGPEPYPCHLSPDGLSANCKCMVLNKTNYTLMNAILNRPIYLDTVRLCGADGSLCAGVNQAPVCNYLTDGALIPGANVISTFDPSTHDDIVNALKGQIPVTVCPKAPYAACMTAPCQLNSDGSTAQCKCPVFYGTFQLIGHSGAVGATCSLGGDLIPSAAYLPALDTPHR